MTETTGADIERNEKGELVGYPPKEVLSILKKLHQRVVFSLEDNAVSQTFDADALTDQDRETLDRFAAEVAGVEKCKVREIRGCGSCISWWRCRYRQGECFSGWMGLGNLVRTDCGWQCWQCASEPCC